ncbi:hypothetical protein SAMN04487886_12187 [Clostridium sp. DSM 8431]|uniref:hypothetical protein n=1 Tax=Clostridium sp. DSM 8431 TaxID=1761781 RepID=UPI0008EB6171|nr:hypothetical protein [Clostridium sp. DSM 8431]SFU84740.1 hypothetical protein SAMN04487886_12187 [Clostridium sp. DSM 8431]
MKWFDIFKLYNLKKLKSEKIIFILLSIFITTLISLLVPQVTENTKEYMYSSVEKLNGADLMVKGNYPSKKFNKELERLRDEGCDMKFEGISGSYLKKDGGRSTAANLIYGGSDIGENQIILYKTIADNMNVNVGDEVEVESTNSESKKYIVKEIEDMPYAVDSDSKVLSYGTLASFFIFYNKRA